MERSQLINTFALISISNIFVNILLQNSTIYLTLLLSLAFGCFILGIFSENKFNIIKKVRNFDLNKINNTLNDPITNTNLGIDSESDSDIDE